MLLDVNDGQILNLPQIGTWPETVHVFDDESIWALNAALASGRPLLIRGEPGCGKSQLARAAAVALKRSFIATVVHYRSESQDLLYEFDSVRRLGEAQAMSGLRCYSDMGDFLAPSKFLSPGPLWWSLNWESAMQQTDVSLSSTVTPHKPKGWKPTHGTVLLIDEIDKADGDLPNGLLEILGNGAFSIPNIGKSVKAQFDAPLPLVIVTTNEERELPVAFLRRCLVLQIILPKDAPTLANFLVERGKSHFNDHCTQAVYQKVAELLITDRKQAIDYGMSPPGLAEYLDILRALVKLGTGQEKHLEVLSKIASFALKKHPVS